MSILHSSARKNINKIKPNIWWVNHGKNFDIEFSNSFIWAPKKSVHDRLIYHWQNVSNVKAGDIILHYSKQFLRCVSLVTEGPELTTSPYKDEYKSKEGYMVRLKYTKLNIPIKLSTLELPSYLFRTSQGPFRSDGKIKQGYLFQFSWEALRVIQASCPETRWPEFAKR